MKQNQLIFLKEETEPRENINLQNDIHYLILTRF